MGLHYGDYQGSFTGGRRRCGPVGHNLVRPTLEEFSASRTSIGKPTNEARNGKMTTYVRRAASDELAAAE